MNIKKRMTQCLLIISIVLMSQALLFSIQITINNPKGGFTTQRIQEIKGTITGFSGNRATLVLNGLPQSIPLNTGNFAINAVVSPGINVVEVKAGQAMERISFYAQVPKRDIKVLLTWDTPTDIDLWVIDPKGEKCYYSQRSTSSGGNLDVDITTGYGPETFTMVKALPGNYSVQVQYYSSGGSPVTRVNVYVVLYEGTPREKRSHYQFVMTKEHEVYHITDFNVE